MKVLVANNIGFCSGVRRAVAIVERELLKRNKPTYSFGPLIHNADYVRRLEKNGLKVISSLEELNKRRLKPAATGRNNRGLVVVPAHGLPPDKVSQVRKHGMRLLDATCPLVRHLANRAYALVEEGWNVVIVGDAHHPEIEYVVGQGQGKPVVVERPAEARTLKYVGKRAVLGQTTLTHNIFSRVVNALVGKSKILLIEDTLCPEVRSRQEEAERLAKQVDIVLVVGGRNSANTTRLREIAKKYTIAYHIENKKDLKEKWFRRVETVAVVAGASTPERIVRDVTRVCGGITDG
jgi:4-hydroxy-3-methylbut-2-enyl diphosphate reductase